MDKTIALSTEHGELWLERTADNRLKLIAKPNSPNYFVSRSEFISSYPKELIEKILDIKGLDYVCDEIARDEDPKYNSLFETGLFAFLDKEAFRNKRLLDFGCGSGASTMALRRILPETEIVGVELEENLLSIARARSLHYGCSGVTFLKSPSGTELPADVGVFDLVIMHAVFEHLLPGERNSILPLLWRVLRSQGVLYIDETPYRFNLIEAHTTGLPLINYLPDWMAHRASCRFSKRVQADETWPNLLRLGIRGASPGEILRLLRSPDDATATLLDVKKNGMRDRVDLWLYRSRLLRRSPLKNYAYFVFKAIKLVSGATIVPEVCLAIRKA
jgi:ubiquinone/menaquinone biosynthesis C-methylase UbiE